MKKKFSPTREYDASKPEIRFEELLKENGYVVKGYKEFMSKTEYLISKNGVDIEFSMANVDNKTKRGNLAFECFEDYFNLKEKLAKLNG